MPASIPFVKMNGIGNSILVVDLRGGARPLTEVEAAQIGRQPGLWFDQLMAISPPRREGTDAFVDIFNIDGSRAGACGNGTRCVAWTMLRGTPATRLLLQTPGGDLDCTKLGEAVYAVDMGPPGLGWRDIPLAAPVDDTTCVPLPVLDAAIPAGLTHFSAVSMGNPHAVFFVENAATVDLARTGTAVERSPIFPDRANVSFAEIKADDHVVLRTWERGAGATLACGSAACATVVAGVRANRLARTARVSQRGGDLTIAWRAADGHVIMTGGVELEHEGHLPAHVLSHAA